MRRSYFNSRAHPREGGPKMPVFKAHVKYFRGTNPANEVQEHQGREGEERAETGTGAALPGAGGRLDSDC